MSSNWNTVYLSMFLKSAVMPSKDIYSRTKWKNKSEMRGNF